MESGSAAAQGSGSSPAPSPAATAHADSDAPHTGSAHRAMYERHEDALRQTRDAVGRLAECANSVRDRERERARSRARGLPEAVPGEPQNFGTDRVEEIGDRLTRTIQPELCERVQPMNVVIRGEGKNGKSTLLNACFGQRLLPDRDVPCTANATTVQKADRPEDESATLILELAQIRVAAAADEEVSSNLDLLRDKRLPVLRRRQGAGTAIRKLEHWLDACAGGHGPTLRPADLEFAPTLEIDGVLGCLDAIGFRANPERTEYKLAASVQPQDVEEVLRSAIRPALAELEREAPPVQLAPGCREQAVELECAADSANPRVKLEYVDGSYEDVVQVSVKLHDPRSRILDDGIVLVDVPGLNQDASRTLFANRVAHTLLVTCDGTKGGFSAEEKASLERWKKTMRAEQIFVVCNKMDSVGGNVAPLTVREADDIIRTRVMVGTPAAVVDGTIAAMPDAKRIAMAEPFRPGDEVRIQEVKDKVEADVREIFPDTPADAVGKTIHFVSAKEALQAQLGGGTAPAEFEAMRTSLRERLDNDRELHLVETPLKRARQAGQELEVEVKELLDFDRRIAEGSVLQTSEELDAVHQQLQLARSELERVERVVVPQLVRAHGGAERNDALKQAEGAMREAMQRAVDSFVEKQAGAIKEAYGKWSGKASTLALDALRERNAVSICRAGEEVLLTIAAEQNEQLTQRFIAAMQAELVEIADRMDTATTAMGLANRAYADRAQRDVDAEVTLDWRAKLLSGASAAAQEYAGGGGVAIAGGLVVIGVGAAGTAVWGGTTVVGIGAWAVATGGVMIATAGVGLVVVGVIAAGAWVFGGETKDCVDKYKQVATQDLECNLAKLLEGYTTDDGAREFDERLKDVIAPKLIQPYKDQCRTLEDRRRRFDEHQQTTTEEAQQYHHAIRAQLQTIRRANDDVRAAWQQYSGTAAQHTFASSAFKRHYVDPDMDPIETCTQVLAAVSAFIYAYGRDYSLSLPAQKQALTKFFQELQQETGHHQEVDVLGRHGVTAELLWTSAIRLRINGHEKELCSMINATIRDDAQHGGSEAVQKAAAISKAINSSLCVQLRQFSPRPEPEDGTPFVEPEPQPEPEPGPAEPEFPAGGVLYRGGGFGSGQDLKDFFQEGKTYRVPGFLATSFDESVARRFMDCSDEPQKIMWVIRIDPRGATEPQHRCKHVNLVTSHFAAAEKEYLFAPYSVFSIDQVEWGDDVTPHRIELWAATDNQHQREDLPLAPWS